MWPLQKDFPHLQEEKPFASILSTHSYIYTLLTDLWYLLHCDLSWNFHFSNSVIYNNIIHVEWSKDYLYLEYGSQRKWYLRGDYLKTWLVGSGGIKKAWKMKAYNVWSMQANMKRVDCDLIWLMNETPWCSGRIGFWGKLKLRPSHGFYPVGKNVID